MSDEEILLKGRSKRAVERLAHFGHLKIRLDKNTDQVTRDIARAYGRAWQVAQSTVKEVSAASAQALHEHGLSPRQIARMDRVDRGMHALERQVRDLDRFTGVHVSGAANRQVQHDVDAVLNSLSSLTGLDRRFTKPSGAAMEGLILRSTDRIESATRRLDADQATALKDGLFRGLLLGENPRTTARHIVEQTKGAFFGGLVRANTLARTEIADAHRYATKLAYTDSELVVGWKWLAQLGPRTCPACWAMHNTFHDKTEMQFGHQNCRCTMVPVLEDDLPADHDLGDPEEIFWGLPREQQLAIMGPGRLSALEAGAGFHDLAILKPATNWRPSIHPTSVTDLSGIADLAVATTPGDIITIPGETNESILTHAWAEGGLTINAVSGEVPTSGFCVARNGTSAVIDARKFFGPRGPAEVAAFLTKYGDLLDKPGAHLGLWYDKHNGKVVLDVVQILKDRDAAIALGRHEDQIAIFDLDTFTEINTGGTGGYASKLTAGLSGADVGKTATITRGGKSYTGTVIAAGSWGVRIKTASGEQINGATDQVALGADAGDRDPTVRRIRDTAKVAADSVAGFPVNYTGASPVSARELDRAFTRVHRDWPLVTPQRADVAGIGEHSYGVTHTQFPGGRAKSQVTVNRKWASDYLAWRDRMQADEDSGHFHRGAADQPADYTATHEMGHVLTMDVLGDPRRPAGKAKRMETMAKVFNALADAHGIDQHFDTHNLSKAKLNAAWKDRFRHLVRRDLSDYATTDPDEMIAEAFAVYREHGRGESVVADTVMQELARAYHTKYGVWPSQANLKELVGS